MGCLCFKWKKNLIIYGDPDGDIKIYNMNFECIQTIEKAYNNSINGLIALNNDSIASFFLDFVFKIYNF